MVQGLIDQVQRFAEGVISRATVPHHGTITGYDPNTHAVKVQLQPDGTLTGWIPLKSPWVGSGWGMFAAPSLGDVVEILFQEGDSNAGTAGLRFFNDEDYPIAVPSGEFWLVHKSGASFKLTNDGAITFSDGKGASIRCDGDGTIASTGSWTHTGKITATDDVVAGTISLKAHKTTGVQPGSGLSGGPQ